MINVGVGWGVSKMITFDHTGGWGVRPNDHFITHGGGGSTGSREGAGFTLDQS